MFLSMSAPFAQAGDVLFPSEVECKVVKCLSGTVCSRFDARLKGTSDTSVQWITSDEIYTGNVVQSSSISGWNIVFHRTSEGFNRFVFPLKELEKFQSDRNYSFQGFYERWSAGFLVGFSLKNKYLLTCREVQK